MLILGIDPGTATIGFGFVEVDVDTPPRALSYGVIQTDKAHAMPDRLATLYADLNELLGEIRPDVMAVEELFFFRNVNTAIPVAQARGVILLAAAQAGVPVVGYTPMQVKLTITGHGHSQKIEVQEHIQQLLELVSIPRPDDAADALSLRGGVTEYLSFYGIQVKSVSSKSLTVPPAKDERAPRFAKQVQPE